MLIYLRDSLLNYVHVNELLPLWVVVQTIL